MTWFVRAAAAIAATTAACGGAAPDTLTTLWLRARATNVCPNPGRPVQLVVIGMSRDGRRVTTPTAGATLDDDRTLRPDRFRVRASRGRVDDRLFYVPPVSALDLLEHHSVAFEARDARQPELTARTQLPIDFRCGGAVALAGSPGRAGDDSSSGTPGDPGPTIEVSVGYVLSQLHGQLVLARIRGPREVATYALIAPGSAPLVIDARGGDGGDGGDGRPAPSTIRTSRELEAASGPAVPPGNGADGGAGGRVILRIDRTHPELRRSIEILVDGGRGGRVGTAPSDAPAATAGNPGPPGRAEVLHDDPAVLFGDEIAAGVPIIVGRARSTELR